MKLRLIKIFNKNELVKLENNITFINNINNIEKLTLYNIMRFHLEQIIFDKIVIVDHELNEIIIEDLEHLFYELNNIGIKCYYKENKIVF